MNLLFLTPQLPYPPRQGTAIRNWGLIRHLGRRHAITLVSFQAAGQPDPAPELRAACARVVVVPAPPERSRPERLRTLLAGEPDLARRLWSPAFFAAVQNLVREQTFDAAQLEGLELAPYLAALGGPGRPRRVVYDAHNVEYSLQQRAALTDRGRPQRWPAAVYSALQWPRLRALEAGVIQAVDAVACVSPEDAVLLQALAPGRAPVVAPNGIDTADYEAAPAAPEFQTGGPAVVFTGKMDYRPNVDAVLWFAAEIWPRLRAARPEARFFIVGQQPGPAVRALAATASITVTGAVDDTRPYIAGAAVYVAPLRMGGGTRFKLLEALALGRPVVATTLGAEGFPLSPGRDLLIADTAADFAAAVRRLLAEPELGRGLGAAGRELVRARYDWSVIVPTLEAVYAGRPLTGQTA